jgi:hypothetical protein
MFTEWLNKDISKALDKSNRVVITDPTKFLASVIGKLAGYCYITLNSPTEEMSARMAAQTAHAGMPVILLCFFSSKQLSHLREFAGVGGFLNFDNPEDYIRTKLYDALGSNVTLPKEKLLNCALLSNHKDLKWWKNIVAETIEPLDVYEYLPSFIEDQVVFQRDNNEVVYQLFRNIIFNIIGKNPTPVDAPTLMRELTNAMFTGLTYNNISKPLLDLYYWWSNSSAHQQFLRQHIDSWQLPSDASPLKAHADHPFAEVDRKILLFIADRIRQNRSVIDIKEAIERRIKSNKAKEFKQPWLRDIFALLSYDSTDMYRYDNITKLTEYYRGKFSVLDTAMRHIYASWLSEPSLLRPIQELYERHLNALLGTWFAIAPNNYRPTQLGLVAKVLSSNTKTAVLVCDGLRLEIANAIAQTVGKAGVEVKRTVEYAKLPSVTENGMSALFGLDEANNYTDQRFATLKAVVPDAKIIKFENLSDDDIAQHLVILFGDIDTVGEHLQLGGLGVINNYETELANAVRRLLRIGYDEVYITADHGFVITGILDDASKVKAPQNVDVKERFFLTDDANVVGNFIRREDNFPGGQYQYYAKTDRPFLTRGVYGYSHGGFTPQECFIPMYQFKSHGASATTIEITNKDDLRNVTGQFFTVHIKGDASAANMRVKVAIYNGSTPVASTLVKLNQNAEESAEFEMSDSHFQVLILDVSTSSQYDSAVVEKNAARDIDDLFN